MKKSLLLIFFLLIGTGCQNVLKMNYDEIITTSLENEETKMKNKTAPGYSYYLPKGISLKENKENNLVLKQDNYVGYMYVDLISQYNKKKEEYALNVSAFYSQAIHNQEKFGYVEINLLENEKYLIEIMYNYAKIEVIVDYKDIKKILSYCISILSSITYNDTIIEKRIGENILNANEIEFNIFETAKNESNLIEYDEDNTSQKEMYVPDTDFIK